MSRKSAVDLFAIAQEEVSSGKVGNGVGEESHIILAGSRGCGKSSIMLRFLDRTETPRATTAMEYTFGRKSKGHNAAVKDVAHIWELGGGSSHAPLLQVPLHAETLKSTSVMVVVDLSKPEALWVTIEKLVREVRSVVEKVMEKLPTEERNVIEAAKKERLSLVKDVAESQSIEMFPLPLVFVGGKYDVYSDFESEKRKVICRTFRFLAHSHGASLVYFSDNSEILVSRIRAFMSHYIFRTNAPKNIVTDHHQPLFIPFGKDSFEGIGNPPLGEGDIGRMQAKSPAELWKLAFNRFFPAAASCREDDLTIPSDPTLADPFFQEKLIDEQRKEKKAEVEKYRLKVEKMNAKETPIGQKN